MRNSRIFIMIMVLALASMACSITFNLPVTNLNVGETQVETIDVAVPDTSGTVDLNLSFGAGELILNPGSGDRLVEGQVTYNVLDLKPEVSTSGSSVTIETGNLEIDGIPNFGDNYKNEWDLRIARDVPMDLSINAGAYSSDVELGGLMLENLQVTDGAAEVHLDFSSPNQTSMDTLRYQTGASSVSLTGLANANFANMVFKGGAGDYTLDFSGELKQSATVDIDSGVSQVTLIVPSNVNARIFFDGGLTNVDVSGNWEKSGNEYVQNGDGPRLTFNVNLGAGNLEIRNR